MERRSHPLVWSNPARPAVELLQSFFLGWRFVKQNGLGFVLRTVAHTRMTFAAALANGHIEGDPFQMIFSLGNLSGGVAPHSPALACCSIFVNHTSDALPAQAVDRQHPSFKSNQRQAQLAAKRAAAHKAELARLATVANRHEAVFGDKPPPDASYVKTLLA